MIPDTSIMMAKYQPGKGLGIVNARELPAISRTCGLGFHQNSGERKEVKKIRRVNRKELNSHFIFLPCIMLFHAHLESLFSKLMIAKSRLTLTKGYSFIHWDSCKLGVFF
ncbi:hypothetical protein ACH5RR_015796 [Cinchona calisaya]|uniref:G-patch domain-containing protein n=1 Tax=Cinchona calisaya TaxID=153742 RepID=A0ABD2ZXS7_9GENT